LRTEAKQILLNCLAATPALRLLRRARDARKQPDHEAIVRYMLDRLRVRREFMGDARITGANMLEIGSGKEFGLAVLLIAIGARRVVNIEIDPYGFMDDATLYRLLVERAAAAGLPLTWPPAGLIVDGDRVRPDPGRIALHLGRSAASIPEPDGSFDITFSVSVLQHVRRADVAPLVRELARVTRPGGMGYHRIDLVDLYHKRTEPFRHLCYTPAQYERMYSRRGTYSNRYRMDDFERIFREAGFREIAFEDIRREDAARFARWLPSFHDEFRNKDPEILRATICMLVATR
jgi:SAM-dependent methyltransferase